MSVIFHEECSHRSWPVRIENGSRDEVAPSWELEHAPDTRQGLAPFHYLVCPPSGTAQDAHEYELRTSGVKLDNVDDVSSAIFVAVLQQQHVGV